MIKIAIADDDQMLVKVFEDFFRNEPYLDCVFHAFSIEDLFEKLRTGVKLDYLFLDIDFSGSSSIEHIPSIKKDNSELEIIMFTNNDDEDHLLKAIFAGASGFLPKSVKFEEIKEYIKMILKGGAAITPQIARKLINHLQPELYKPKADSSKVKKMTSKELQILSLIAKGYGYQNIADTIGLTINGVRYHIKKIYKQLHVSNRAEAVAIFKSGLLDEE